MFRRFLSYYKPYRRVFILDMICATIIALCGVAFPIIIRQLLAVFRRADITSTELLSTVEGIAILLLSLYLLQAVCQWYVTSAGHIMGAKIEYDMRREIFSHMEKLSFSYFDKHSTGAMVSRLLSDLFDITELAHHGPENLILSGLEMLGAFVFLLFLNVRVTLILFAVTLLMFAFSFCLNVHMRRVFYDNRRKVAGINAVVQDSLSGIRTVVSYNNEEKEQDRFNENNYAFLNSKKENYFLMGRYVSVNGFLEGMMYISVVLGGGFAVASGEMQAADVVIYILYISTFLVPIKTLINFTEQFQKGWTGFQRFTEILDTEPEIKDLPGAQEAGQLEGHIRFEDVSFAYEKDESILQHIDLDIPARKTIALVGPSGAGKTTFCSLIPRYYDVTAGRITIDGRDIRSITLDSLRRNIAVVQQDVYIFNTTVRDNIAYGRQGATDEEVMEAARKAHIHDFIMSLPDGYDTLCGEHGVRFSGGQKQRISIARVFLKNPPILILDEATSALDNQSEVLIQDSLNELSRDRTSFVIAHRLSTIRHADEILVLTTEGIVERGKHEELLAQGGLYKELYELQFIPEAAGKEKAQ